MGNTIRVGSGYAWWGDRVEPAALNAEKGQLDYLCFVTMAEATVSAAKDRNRRGPLSTGYDTYLDARIRAAFQPCILQAHKPHTNPGWKYIKGPSKATNST